MTADEARAIMNIPVKTHELFNLYIKCIDDYILNAANNKADYLNFKFDADNSTEPLIRDVAEHYQCCGFEVIHNVLEPMPFIDAFKKQSFTPQMIYLTISWRTKGYGFVR